MDEVDTSLISYQGSNLNDALLTSLENFNEENQKSRAVILISDGENHQDSLSDTISKVKKKKITIHTIAIGKREGAPVPGSDGFKKDSSGNTVISKVNTRPLLKIADATGGSFTHVQGNLMDLSKIYQSIKGGVDNINISQGRRKVPLDGYQIPLLISLVLLLLIFFLRKRLTVSMA